MKGELDDIETLTLQNERVSKNIAVKVLEKAINTDSDI